MRILRSLVLVLALASFPVACADNPVEPDVRVEDLVGDWDATVLLFTNPLNPSEKVDAIELGAEFFLNIQPSGGYTSSISYQGLSATELGQLTVDGGRLIFDVQIASTGPRVDTAQFQLDGNSLSFEGRTVFDFNLDGIGESAALEVTLQR